MAKVIITKGLEEEINRKFKGESIKIFELMYSLKECPTKGKPVGQVSGIVIKELKYRNFRFYFITDGYKLKMLSSLELNDLLIKFVRISNKKDQQETINEIRKILLHFGPEGFS